MAEDIDRWLGGFDAGAMRDRRNGIWRRHLLSELDDIELLVPRTRRYRPISVLKSHARRAPEIYRAILASLESGLGTRKVGEVTMVLLGRPVLASTVSRVAKSLDGAAEAFHARPLANRYKTLMLDGVVLGRGTGAGTLKRPIPVAPGLRSDGKKEVIDVRLARSESAAEWERFLDRLHHRRMTGDGLEMICVDGGKGLRQPCPDGFVFCGSVEPDNESPTPLNFPPHAPIWAPRGSRGGREAVVALSGGASTLWRRRTKPASGT